MRYRRERQGLRFRVTRYPSDRNAGFPGEVHAFLRQACLADPGSAGQENPARLTLAESGADRLQLTDAAEERPRLSHGGGAGVASGRKQRGRGGADVADRFAAGFDMGHEPVAAPVDRANDVLALT